MEVLEEDDGSGWVKVADEAGGKGLVPASYISVLDSASQAGVGESHGAGVKAGDYGKVISCYFAPFALD